MRRRWRTTVGRTSAGVVLATLLAVVLPAVLLPAADAPAASLAPTGLAPTPPMGVNSWNATACSPAFDEAWVRAQADALVTSGLRDLGYRYVNLDDCWAAPRRDADGRLVPDPVRFPHGIAALADYVHARGLKLGIYTDSGDFTCSGDPLGFPGSLGHETADAASFASWGVDYIKDDDCFLPRVDTIARYTAMAAAVRATGRPMVLALCEKGVSRPWLWAPGIAELWRTTPDIADTWTSTVANLRGTLPLSRYAGPGRWNDPDMLEVGNGGMTPDEQRSQFALWSMLAAPLLAGTDLATASPATLALLGNRGLVAVDQDPLGAPVDVVADDPDGRLVLRRPLQGGDVATSVTALGGTPVTVPAGVVGTDLLTGSPVGPGTVVPVHGTVAIRQPQ